MLFRKGIKVILKQFVKATLKFYLLFKPNPPFERSKVKKVLVYAYTGLGNFILFTPTLRAIRKYLPQASFTLLYSNDTGCQEVVKGSSLFDKYIVVKRNADWWTKLKWIYRFRKDKYDLIISEFHNNNLFMVILTVLSGAKYRLGHVTSSGWDNPWDWIYNIPVKMKENQHERDRYLELAYALGISEQDVDKKPFIHIDANDRNFAKRFFASHGIDSRHKIVSIQLGTSPAMRWKQWGLDKYRKLCDEILKLPNTKVILLGSPDEVDMIEKVAAKVTNGRPIVAAGKTTVKQSTAIIEKSDLLICNDSGLMHVAVAVDTPVVAIYGPTDYTRTAPLGKKHTIIRKDLNCSPCFRLNGTKRVENCPYGYKCLKLITVEEVFEVVRKKLELKEGWNFNDKTTSRYSFGKKLKAKRSSGMPESSQTKCKLCGSTQLQKIVSKGKVGYFKCAQCGLVMQIPLPDEDKSKAIYDKGASYFRDRRKAVDYIKGETWLKKTASFYISIISQYIKEFNQKKLDILDVGCGTGVLVKAFVDMGHNAQGVELSKWASDFGKKRYKVEIIQGNIEKLNLPLSSYDIITAMHVVEHLRKPQETLRYLVEHLKEGGYLVLATPNSACLTARLVKQYWRYYIPDEHLFLFSPTSLKLLVERVGLRVVGYETALYENVSMTIAYYRLLKQVLKSLAKKIFISINSSINAWGIPVQKWKEQQINFASPKDGLIIITRKKKCTGET